MVDKEFVFQPFIKNAMAFLVNDTRDRIYLSSKSLEIAKETIELLEKEL